MVEMGTEIIEGGKWDWTWNLRRLFTRCPVSSMIMFLVCDEERRGEEVGPSSTSQT